MQVLFKLAGAVTAGSTDWLDKLGCQILAVKNRFITAFKRAFRCFSVVFWSLKLAACQVFMFRKLAFFLCGALPFGASGKAGAMQLLSIMYTPGPPQPCSTCRWQLRQKARHSR